ncbi:iron-sulfur flavoprotein [Candidatus Methanoplasma termitum]|uniref:Iron-sulfur flavoprotein n=1 Tax=Candidatus Methanoplasma termitum TaxID=1577791 RepID=A0A0A7LG03_9ARCH|nr:flavodoxin family protein [Candidatus Methanoplasma termitum]AIZ56436.1 iron-sulfur flavoprotein [Candidatus Methanoplasma termitum]MCL2333995.1 flavodoxin family protein [Candidatus Methanoplasma sp.]
MKVVGFNCSPRKEGNTSHMIKEVFKVLNAEGIETEMIQVGGKDLHGCRACGACGKNKNMRCIMDDDVLNMCIQKMVNADGIIIGSPTYFADVTAETKALIDRSGYVTRPNGMALRRKVGAAVVPMRRAGGIHAFDTINHFFSVNEMITIGSSYWNVSTARAEGEFEKDEEGLKTMKCLGENMAWILKKIKED